MNRTEKQITVVLKKKKEWMPVEQNFMELCPIFNTTKEEQEKGVAKRELGKGWYIEISKDIKEEEELIRDEDLITLLCCFLLMKHSTRKGNTFETSYDRFFTQFGRGKYKGGGWRYERLKKSFQRLQSNNATTNFWFSTISGERVVLARFHFIESVKEGEKQSLSISLNPDIVESMEHGYLRWLEEKKLKDILHLKKFARILVLFLMKRINDGPMVKYKIESILDLLGVREKYEKLPRYRYNFNVRRTVIPAVEKAANMLGYSCTYKQKEGMVWIEKKPVGKCFPMTKGT